tara:strand:- start:1092 stop:1484 length:393 start_codon:yes stop_codon:yes gene_type:complete
MKLLILTFSFIFSLLVSGEQKVYFINLNEGDKLESPFLVQFGLSGIGVAPAGTDRANTGHHHLLINVNSVDLYMPIPSSKNHLHFGGGQTETTLDLLPGEYTLQLLLGDMNHIPHTPPIISKKISVTVAD